MDKTQRNIESTYPELLARLEKIDVLIRTASEKAELPPFKEIIDEWTDVLAQARKRVKNLGK